MEHEGFMKTLSNIANKFIPKTSEPVLCDYISIVGEYQKIEPTLSNELTCPICGGTEHYTPLYNPSIDSKRTWLCGNRFCPTLDYANIPRPVRSIALRVVDWPEFCRRMRLPEDSYGI